MTTTISPSTAGRAWTRGRRSNQSVAGILRGINLRPLLISLLMIYFAAHGAFSFLGFTADSHLGSEDDAVHRIEILLVWAMAGVLMVEGAPRLLRTVMRQPLIMTLPLVAFASMVWSQAANVTLHKSAYLLLTTVFALYLASRYGPEQLMRCIMICGFLCTTAGLALAVAVPRFGRDQLADVGALQGIFVGKNVCALETLFLLMPAFFIKPRGLLQKLLRGGYVVLLLGAIVLTKSRTGLALAVVYLVFVVCLSWLGRFSRRDMVILLTVVMVGLSTAAAVALGNTNVLLSHLGRDATLTGRTQIWEALLLSLAKHPLTGYGYGAFWLGTTGEDMNVFERIHWVMGYAHNGYLEVAIQLGFIGLAVVAIMLLKAAKNALVVFRRTRPRYVDWYLSIVYMTLIYNIDESFMGGYHRLPWMLFLIASVGLASEARNVLRQQREAGAWQRWRADERSGSGVVPNSLPALW